MPAKAIARTTQTITQASSPVDSSMSRDVADGRTAEVEQQLARRGRRPGIKTPLPDLAPTQLRVYNNRLLSSR